MSAAPLWSAARELFSEPCLAPVEVNTAPAASPTPETELALQTTATAGERKYDHFLQRIILKTRIYCIKYRVTSRVVSVT